MGIAYALFKRFLYDPRGKRSTKVQTAFRDEIITQYDLNAPGGLIWDVVLGSYVHKSTLKAAHIVPCTLPPEAIDLICGAGTGSRQTSWENGLLMNSALERHFDRGDVVIVPFNSQEHVAVRFVLRIAIHGVGTSPVQPGIDRAVTLGDLDGKELQFKNSKRPMLRFLYWRYITSLLGNRKNREEHCRQEYEYEDLKSATPWMTLKPYLRQGILLTMAKEAGCMDDEVISSTLARITDGDDEIASQYSMNEMLGHIALADPEETGNRALDMESGPEDEEDEDVEMVEEVEASEIEDIDTDDETSSDEE